MDKRISKEICRSCKNKGTELCIHRCADFEYFEQNKVLPVVIALAGFCTSILIALIALLVFK